MQPGFAPMGPVSIFREVAFLCVEHRPRSFPPAEIQKVFEFCSVTGGDRSRSTSLCRNRPQPSIDVDGAHHPRPGSLQLFCQSDMQPTIRDLSSAVSDDKLRPSFSILVVIPTAASAVSWQLNATCYPLVI